MNSRSGILENNIIFHRKQPQRCCICNDIQILVEYLDFWVCSFCVAGEKDENEGEPTE